MLQTVIIYDLDGDGNKQFQIQLDHNCPKYYVNTELRQSQTLKTYKLRDRSSGNCEQTNKQVSKHNMKMTT